MKKRQRNSLGHFVRGSKSEVSFVNLSTYTSPEIIEVPNQDWIAYGDDNNYFQFLIGIQLGTNRPPFTFIPYCS